MGLHPKSGGGCELSPRCSASPADAQQRWYPSPIPSSSISPPTMGSPFSLEREICSPGALYGL